MDAEDTEVPFLSRFFAMEYYSFILNRTFEITLDEKGCSGAFVRGIIPTRSPGIIMAGLENDPIHLVNSGLLEEARAHPRGSAQYLSAHRFNFSWDWSCIKSVRHNPRKKWGMGSIQHDGRFDFEHQDGTREFIALGRGRASDILAALRASGRIVVTA